MKLSVLLAVRNEAEFLPDLLSDLDVQEDPGCEIEVLLGDGESDDGTAEIARTWCAQTNLPARVLVNPARRQYPGVNALIGAAGGDAMLLLDGHCRIAPDFLLRVAANLREERAEIVGGVMASVGRSGTIGSALAAAQSTRLGAGGAAFRIATQAGFVHSVCFPAIRRHVFEKVGLFQVELLRNADTEFYDRVGKAGFRVWLDPSIRSSYLVRATIGSTAAQQFANGLWFPALWRAARPRHLVPLVFVLALIGLPLIALLITPIAGWFLAAMLGVYLLAITGTALVAKQEGLDRAGRARMLVVLPVMHLSYGVGWLAGIFHPTVWRGARATSRPPPSLPRR
jgi:succinoglycan biosynthesis protein ExoA